MFYKSEQEDLSTWCPLIKLVSQMRVLLFLMILGSFNQKIATAEGNLVYARHNYIVTDFFFW